MMCCLYLKVLTLADNYRTNSRANQIANRVAFAFPTKSIAVWATSNTFYRWRVIYTIHVRDQSIILKRFLKPA